LLAAREPDSGVGSVTAWYLTLKGDVGVKPRWLTRSGAALLDATLADNLERLERTLARPRANRHLPDRLRLVEVREWLDTENEIRHIQDAEWVPPAPEIMAVLERLARG